MATNSQAALGRRVRDLRVKARMSQAQLAYPELSDSYISLIESGKRTPTASVIEFLARKLDCSVAYLTSGVSDQEASELRMSLKFAEIALQNGEADEAYNYFSRVLENGDLATLPGLAYEARWGYGRALEALGRLEDAVVEFEKLVQHVSPESEPEAWARLHVAICRCHRDRGDFSAAGTAGEQGLQLLVESHDRWTECMVMLAATLLSVYYWRGDFVYARQFAGQVIKHAESVGSAQARGAAYWNAGVAAYYRGDLEEALHLIERALALFGEGDDARNIAKLRVECGRILLSARPEQAERARDLLVEARQEMVGTAAGERDEAETVIDLAKAEIMVGRPAEAVGLAREAIEKLGVGPRITTADALIVLASAHVRLGDVESAVSELRQAAEQLEVMHSTRHAAQAWLELAELFGEAGDEVGQVEAYRRAMKCVGI